MRWRYIYQEVSACGCEPEAAAPAMALKAFFQRGDAAELSCFNFLMLQQRGIYWWSREGGQCHQLYFKPQVCNYPFFPEGIIQVFSLSRMHNLKQVPMSKSLARKPRNRLGGLFKWKDGKNLGFFLSLGFPDHWVPIGKWIWDPWKKRGQRYSSAASNHSHEKADRERSHAYAKLCT